MLTRKDKITAAIFIPTGIMSISVASILIKICAAPPVMISVYRLSIAAMFYLSVMKLQRRKVWSPLTKRERLLAVCSGLFLSLHFITWISSLKYTSVASSVVLVQMAPIFVAFGSYFLIHEKPTNVTWIGMAIALSGSILLAIDDFSGQFSSVIGNLLALMGAFCAAGYFLIGRKLRSQLITTHYVSLVYSIAALITIFLALLRNESFVNYEATTIYLFFAIAFFPQIIGHTSLNWALKHFTATAVSIIALAEPIGASILALIFLHEPLTPFKIFTGLIVLSGVIITLLGDREKKNNPPINDQ